MFSPGLLVIPNPLKLVFDYANLATDGRWHWRDGADSVNYCLDEVSVAIGLDSTIKQRPAVLLEFLPFIDVTPKADHFDVDDFDSIFDGVDNPDVTDPQSVTALQFTTEGLNVTMVEGIFH